MSTRGAPIDNPDQDADSTAGEVDADLGADMPAARSYQPPRTPAAPYRGNPSGYPGGFQGGYQGGDNSVQTSTQVQFVPPPAGPVEGKFQKYWRPAAATVYLLICLFDFVAMPLVVQASHKQVDWTAAVTQSLKFSDPAAQMHALDVLTERSSRVWDPLTLKESAFFHIAFGAILGAAAFTRGQEKIERARRGT